MPLLAVQISEMLRAVRSDRKSTELRRAPRIPLRAKVDLAASPHARTPGYVWIRNISFTGVSVLHTKKLARGDTLILQFQDVDQQVVPVACEVVHCHVLSSQFFLIGAKFIGEPFGSPSESASERVSA
ncbi:MAG TPA: PilZ domain-containing protein [Tepidisphaeraceae bacterium]|jgi:hypothetical protein|nr:PilZ domain-containing protein [Tepidisphaeraceae bacterium]